MIWPFRRKTRPAKVLILGGTEEARHLAETLQEMGVDTVTSLAGRTADPQVSGPLRSGGFGGVEGLAKALTEGGYTVLVDATHPFAIHMSPVAKKAAKRVRVPYLRLERPPWRRMAGDRWITVPTIQAAADALPRGAHAFLAVGSHGLAPFLDRADLELTVRAIEPPDLEGRDDVTVITGRGPFDIDEERALIDSHDFDALVTKNAGGEATAAKLIAARERRLLVVMVERPRGQPRPHAANVDEMLRRLRRYI